MWPLVNRFGSCKKPLSTRTATSCARQSCIKAIESSRKISRNDFKELQVLMTLEPQSLSDEQRLRLFDLKELFDATMPPNTTRCRQPR